MNNLSNERLEQIAMHGAQYNTPEARQMARELLALREAGKEPVAFTEKHEISNMQATGLYLRAWPADRERNAIEGYTVPLYAAPQLPAVPEGWVMVPLRPTQHMLAAGYQSYMKGAHNGRFYRAYQSMIAAAPKPDGSNG